MNREATPERSNPSRSQPRTSRSLTLPSEMMSRMATETMPSPIMAITDARASRVTLLQAGDQDALMRRPAERLELRYRLADFGLHPKGAVGRGRADNHVVDVAQQGVAEFVRRGLVLPLFGLAQSM
jgi:hypothetical protein